MPDRELPRILSQGNFAEIGRNQQNLPEHWLEMCFCEDMLVRLWCISVADVLLDVRLSMFWFNSTNSGRILLIELMLSVFWLQIIIPAVVILLLPSK